MHFINDILNIFYPNACGICGRIYKYDICPKCMRKLNELKQCKKHIYLRQNFFNQMSIFKYEDLIRECIIKYKFGEQNYRYKSFANFIRKDKKIYGFIKKYDIIIPVPISKNRIRKRGYNQSKLIVCELAKQDENIKIATNVLYKIKNTVPQSSLGKEQRLYNLKDAFQVQNENTIKNRKVLLFDDIYTTGSTVEECAKVLKYAGANEVRSINTCKGLKKGEVYGRFS